MKTAATEYFEAAQRAHAAAVSALKAAPGTGVVAGAAAAEAVAYTAQILFDAETAASGKAAHPLPSWLRKLIEET